MNYMIKIMINLFWIFPVLLDDKRGSDVIDYASAKVPIYLRSACAM